MKKLPWIKLWFDDLDQDCGCLSLAARGAWVWILGHLHNTGGQYALTLEGWSRVIRASVQQTAVVMAEIIDSHTCDAESDALIGVTPSVTRDALSQKSDALISIRCRRMVKEAKARHLHALRQSRYRSKDSGEAHSDAAVTKERQKQKHKVTRHSKSDASKSGDGGKSRDDPTYEIFACQFEKARGLAYASKTGDFVQLSKRRQASGLDGKSDIPGFSDACVNYFSSLLSKYTLADLCSRLDVFLHGSVDRFGREVVSPASSPPHPSDQPGAEPLFDLITTPDGRRVARAK